MSLSQSSRQITEGVIWKQLLIFFFPILMGSFFQQMYNTVDTIIVGRFVGTEALAAVGASAPILSLVGGFFIGLSSGATVILAQCCGAGDRTGASKVMHTGIALALALGVIVTLVGVGMAPQLLRLINTPESCFDDAVLYCRIYFSGALASMLYNMGAGILRARGDARRPMLFLILCCIINVVGDLLFICVFHLGIAGAGIATVLAQLISAVLILFVLMRQEDKLVIRQIRFHTNILGNILKIGIPAGIQLMMFDLSNLTVQSAINSFGDITVAGWAAVVKTDGLTWQISGAFGIAVTTFVGQNFGAQKYDRVRRSVWVCMGLSIAIVGGLSILEYAFRHFLLGIYTTDPQVIAIGAEIIARIVLFNAVFMPIEVFAGAMRGTGYSLAPTLIMCVCICLFRVVWVLCVVNHFHTIAMLALAYPLSWILCASVFFIVYCKGDWLHKPIAALGMAPEIR